MIQAELTPAQKETLRRLPERFPPERMDRVWIFSPQVVNARESGFLIVTLIPGSEPVSHRTLLTVRYETETIRGRIHREERVTEEGSAPPDRIERVIAGVLVRSGDDAPEPAVAEIGGEPARWFALLEQVGITAEPPA